MRRARALWRTAQFHTMTARAFPALERHKYADLRGAIRGHARRNPPAARAIPRYLRGRQVRAGSGTWS